MSILYLPQVVKNYINSKKALGIDVSRWQGVMNWDTAFKAGAKFTFIRAGSIDNVTGVCYEDYQFQRNSEIAPQYMPVGYYWYMRPQYSPDKQAEFYFELVKDKDCDFGLVDDAEVDGGLSPVYVDKQHKLFCKRLQELSGRKPILYTSLGFWKYSVPNSSGIPTWAAELDLWMAQYTSALSPTLPATWSAWKFWQWSADGNLRGKEFGATGSQSIDINYFNGTEAELLAYADSGPLPPIEPPPTPEGFTLTALYDGQNVRTGPGLDYPIVGQLNTGDVIEVEEIAGYSAWVKFDGDKWAAVQYGAKTYLE